MIQLLVWSKYSDLTRPISPKGSVLEGKSPAISGKSRERWNIISFGQKDCFFPTIGISRFKLLLPWKLTCPLKRDYFSREYIFQPLAFRGHVGFQGSRLDEGLRRNRRWWLFHRGCRGGPAWQQVFEPDRIIDLWAMDFSGSCKGWDR